MYIESIVLYIYKIFSAVDTASGQGPSRLSNHTKLSVNVLCTFVV